MDIFDKLKSAFHIAVENKDFKTLEYLVKQLHANINMVDRDQQTPIFTAVEKKDLALVKFLADKGANLEHKEILHRTPLYFAAGLGCLDIIEYFIAKGCDVNVPSSMGRTALGKACWNGAVDVARVLLQVPNINIDYPDGNNR